MEIIYDVVFWVSTRNARASASRNRWVGRPHTNSSGGFISHLYKTVKYFNFTRTHTHTHTPTHSQLKLPTKMLS